MTVRLLSTLARPTADPHNITLVGATAGRDIVLLAHAPAVITTPVGWVLLASRVSSTGGYVFRLPAASNPGGDIAVTLDLSGARAVAVVALESDMDVPTFYSGTLAGSSSATAYGAGLHTFTERDHAIAFHMPAKSTSGLPTQTPSYDSGWTGLADTGWAGTATSGDEAVRIFAGRRDNVALNAEGAIVTVGTTASAPIEFAGVLAWDATGASEPPPGPGPTTFGATIPAENALPGHSRASFEFTSAQWTRPGYADGFTYNVGDVVPFKVDSPEAFTVEIFRLGYYGGAGARRVTTITGTASTQPAATINPTTLEADASSWTTNATWTIPADAVSGLYIALIRGATAGNFWRTPFVVRDDAQAADVIVKMSDTTWQAYNAWGGKDLYGTDQGFSDGDRSFAVRYDRPIITERMRPQSSWENAEWPLIQYLERNGYSVKYVSSLDVDRDPTILLGAKVVISSGHDEYWSSGIWDAFVAARAAGVHTIFMTGNEAFWRVRFTDNRKRMVCYKDTKPGTKIDPGAFPTGTWQDTRGFNAAHRRAPASLTGSRFIANGIREDTLRVPSDYKTSPFWRNTTVATVADGSARTFPGVLGFEWNGYFPGENEIPANHISLSATSITLTNQMADINGDQYNLTGTPEHRIVLMKHTSGALTLGLGMNQWAWGLGSIRNRGVSYGVAPDLKQATYNVLTDMGAAAATPEAGIVTSAPATYTFPNDSAPPASATLRVYHAGAWVDVDVLMQL